MIGDRLIGFLGLCLLVGTVVLTVGGCLKLAGMY